MTELDIGLLIDAGSGVLLVTLGLVVLLRKRRTLQMALFGLFAMGLGVPAVSVNLGLQSFVSPTVSNLLFALTVPVAYAGTIILIALVLLYPERLPARRWPVWIVPAFIATGTFVVGSYLAVVEGGSRGAAPLHIALDTAWYATLAGMLFALSILPIRVIMTKDDVQSTHDGVFLSAAFVIWIGVHSGAMVFSETIVFDRLAGFFAVVFAAGVWLFSTGLGPRHGSRAGRNLAWLHLGTLLAGMGLGVAMGGYAGLIDSGVMGAARTVSVLIIGVAILRHQFMGLDVKLRHGISGSTVAAAFVAVFFVVSETVTEFLAVEAGWGPWLGILAAGLLLLVLAPLQRFAGRLAERAVPMTPDAVAAPHRVESAYTHAVQAAMRDGFVTPREEEHLADLAQDLGLGAGDALRIRRDLERSFATKVDASRRAVDTMAPEAGAEK